MVNGKGPVMGMMRRMGQRIREPGIQPVFRGRAPKPPMPIVAGPKMGMSVAPASGFSVPGPASETKKLF